MTFADLIASAHAWLAQFDYDHYPDNFRAFEAAAGPLFDALEAGDAAAQADALITQLEQRRQALPRRAQKEAAYRDKQVLALFLSPAAQRRSEAARAFSETLCARWTQRYPRNPYLLGDYEQIMKGFDANLLGLPLRKSNKRGS